MEIELSEGAEFSVHPDSTRVPPPEPLNAAPPVTVTPVPSVTVAEPTATKEVAGSSVNEPELAKTEI